MKNTVTWRKLLSQIQIMKSKSKMSIKKKKLHLEEGKNKAEAQNEENNIMKTLIYELYNNQRVKWFPLAESPFSSIVYQKTSVKAKGQKVQDFW